MPRFLVRVGGVITVGVKWWARSATITVPRQPATFLLLAPRQLQRLFGAAVCYILSSSHAICNTRLTLLGFQLPASGQLMSGAGLGGNAIRLAALT